MLTEDLLDLLNSQVVAASAEHVASVGVLFDRYSRIRDMKDIDRTKALPIKVLKKYLKKVSLSKLEYISSYTARPKVLPVNSRAINHIA